jgi:hypothetical protein
LLPLALNASNTTLTASASSPITAGTGTAPGYLPIQYYSVLYLTNVANFYEPYTVQITDSQRVLFAQYGTTYYDPAIPGTPDGVVWSGGVLQPIWLPLGGWGFLACINEPGTVLGAAAISPDAMDGDEGVEFSPGSLSQSFVLSINSTYPNIIPVGLGGDGTIWSLQVASGDQGYGIDGYKGSTELGSVVWPIPGDPGATYPEGTYVQPINVNNSNDYVSFDQNYTANTNSYHLHVGSANTLLTFTDTTNYGNTRMSARDANGIVRAINDAQWWDGSVMRSVSDASSLSGINAATTLGSGGTNVPAYQMIGMDSAGNGATWSINPVSGLLGSAQELNPLVSSAWTNIVPYAINDSGAIVATATYTGTNSTILAQGADYNAVLLLPNQITRDGNSINSTNNTVCVGQQINLTNVISGVPSSAITSYQWNIPGATNGTAFYDYEPTVTNSNYTNLFTPTNYTTNSYCNFYWSSPGTNVVTCTEVIYGQTNTVSATLNVLGPTNTGISATEGTIGINALTNELTFGQIAGPGSPPAGMLFTPTYTSPSGFAGTNAWIQLLPPTNQSSVWVFPTQTITAGITGGNDAVAGQVNFYYPYSVLYPGGADDSPNASLPTSATNVTRYFDATMYSMWKPYSTNSLVNGDNTVWVPLRSYHWNWYGVATNGAPTASWGLAASTLPNRTDTNVIVTQEPIWTSTNADIWSTNTP